MKFIAGRKRVKTIIGGICGSDSRDKKEVTVII